MYFFKKYKVHLKDFAVILGHDYQSTCDVFSSWQKGITPQISLEFLSLLCHSSVWKTISKAMQNVFIKSGQKCLTKEQRPAVQLQWCHQPGTEFPHHLEGLLQIQCKLCSHSVLLSSVLSRNAQLSDLVRLNQWLNSLPVDHFQV